MQKITELLNRLEDFVEEPSLDRRLLSLTSQDGRYGKATYKLANFCSEAGLQRLRTLVEIEYVIFICENEIAKGDVEKLRDVYRKFTLEDARRIKEIESEINHDVKAVEYFIVENLDVLDLPHLKPSVHKFLTSEDVTNVAIGLMVFASRDIISQEIDVILADLIQKAERWKDVPMLALTHGQPASPTTVGKELIIFANRLQNVNGAMMALPIEVKWNGATGNYNAHNAAQSEKNWIAFSQCFIEETLGLSVELFTTQTNHYLFLADILHQMKNVSSILIDLSVDMWLYISREQFKLKVNSGEVGSSVMPHKVNPIDFENAEGNLNLAEANFGFLASVLQKSRLQRHLSDSTTLRNLGAHFGSLLIALKSIQRGLKKIDINESALQRDLVNNPAVISEAIQSIMREGGIDDAYEQLKEYTRGRDVSFDELREFICTLKGQLSDEMVDVLEDLLPEKYTGLASDLTEYFLRQYVR